MDGEIQLVVVNGNTDYDRFTEGSGSDAIVPKAILMDDGVELRYSLSTLHGSSGSLIANSLGEIIGS